ncbi:MAG: AIR synthase related protein, partial [Actinomadura sp.]
MGVITIGELGEFGLIARITQVLTQGPAVDLGPGDDAAVVRAPDGRVVATSDLLVEGRHFRRDWSSAYDVGRKAAAQNLADVAAMGAHPTALLVGFAAPPETPVAWAVALCEGLRDECEVVGASVVGGDVVRAPAITVAVTALGDLSGARPLTR